MLTAHLSSAGRQWIMMQVRDFDEAKQANFQGQPPVRTDVEIKVQIATEAEDKWAQAMALRSRNELLASAILAATAILILFLRLKRQEHLNLLQETERSALQGAKSASALSRSSPPTSFLSPIRLLKSATLALRFMRF